MDNLEMSPDEKALVEEGLRRGVLTDHQIRECLQLRDQMRQLGLEADLAKALLEKRHLTEEQLSTLTARPSSENCFRHPDRTAASRCDTCGRPLCADCVIRVGTTTLCGETCAAPRREPAARPEATPAEKRRSRWIVIGSVAGAGVVLTVFLWLLSRHFSASADYAAYKELLAKKEYGSGVQQREVELLEKITTRWPKDSEAHVYLARTYRRAGEADGAVRLLAAFLERYPGNDEARFELALCHLVLHDAVRARGELEELLRRRPEHAEAARKLALLLVEHFPDEVSESEGAIRASLTLQPEDRSLRYHLARIYRQKGMPAEAAKELEAALEPVEPTKSKSPARETAALSGRSGSNVYLLAAEIRLDEGKTAAAVPLLEQSLQLYSGNVAAATLLAKMYVRLDENAKARRLLTALSNRFRANVTVWETLAELDEAEGDIEAYASDLEKIYALRPEDLDLAMKLLEVRLNVGDVKGAEILMRELGTRGGSRVVELRARMALEQGRTEEAKRLLEGLPSEEAREPSVILMLARLEKATGRSEEAIRLLSGLVKGERLAAGLLSAARVHLGLALWQRGDGEAAAAEFEKAVTGGGPEKTTLLAEKLLALAQGEVLSEPAVDDPPKTIQKAVRGDETMRSSLGLLWLASIKAPLYDAAFGLAATTKAGTASARKRRRESSRSYMKRCLKAVARAEVAAARVLASKQGVSPAGLLVKADGLTSSGEAGAEVLCAALDVQLDVIRRILEREGLKPNSEFLGRKAAALEAIQDSPEARAVAKAYVLAEALCGILPAGETGWAYERTAKSLLDSMYTSDALCGGVLEQLCNAERTQVLLLNMLALKRRDEKLLAGP